MVLSVFRSLGISCSFLPDGSLYLINGLNMLPAFSIAVANLLSLFIFKILILLNLSGLEK